MGYPDKSKKDILTGVFFCSSLSHVSAAALYRLLLRNSPGLENCTWCNNRARLSELRTPGYESLEEQKREGRSLLSLSHFPDSNRGPTQYECVALPPEPKWQLFAKAGAKVLLFFDIRKFFDIFFAYLV